ncbi:hypothetical protein GGI03_004641 [Coemansia sp. RSA 2337]|nr:hypothetical protein GGI03_004641 [Coemansia sp. RSA 2337]
MSNRQGSSSGRRQAPAPSSAGSGSRRQGQSAPAPSQPYNPPNWDTWKETGYSNRYYNKMMEYAEREMNNRADQECDDLRFGRLSINNQVRTTEQRESKYNELEADVTALQTELDEKDDLLKKRKESDSKIYLRLARLDKQEEELSALSVAHKAHIRCLINSLDQKKQTIAELEKRIQ